MSLYNDENMIIEAGTEWENNIYWHDARNGIRVHADTLLEYLQTINNPNDTPPVRKYLRELESYMADALRALNNLLKIYRKAAYCSEASDLNRDAYEELRTRLIDARAFALDSPLVRTKKLERQLSSIFYNMRSDEASGCYIRNVTSRRDWIDDKHLFRWFWFDRSGRFPTDEQLEATLVIASISIDQAVASVEQAITLGI